jgi:hypothetical protein
MSHIKTNPSKSDDRKDTSNLISKGILLSDRLSTQIGSAQVEEMEKYEISYVPVDYFHYKNFRYTKLTDALAQAKRDVG